MKNLQKLYVVIILISSSTEVERSQELAMDSFTGVNLVIHITMYNWRMTSVIKHDNSYIICSQNSPGG